MKCNDVTFGITTLSLTLVGLSNVNVVGVTMVLEGHWLLFPCTHLDDTVLF